MSLSFDKSKNSKTDPRSKIFQNPEKLEDWELIAILIGKGTKGQNIEELSRSILSKFSGLFGLLNTSPSALFKQTGLGKAKIASLLAVREMVNRLKLHYLKKSSSKSTSLVEVMELLYLRTAKEVRECFYLITFNYDKSLINMELIARGGLTEVGIFPRDIVKMALDDGAMYAIVAHNHPKQSCEPSKEDYILFKELHKILASVDVELMDQWVSGEEGIFSCYNKKRIFQRSSPSFVFN